MNGTMRVLKQNYSKTPYFTVASLSKDPFFSSWGSPRIVMFLTRECKKKNPMIERIAQGSYCFLKEIKGTGIRYGTPTSEYVRSRYMGTEKKPIGYISGLSFLNGLGLSDDIPGTIEIVSNIEKSRGRIIEIGSSRYYLRKPYVRVTKENAFVLPVVDMLARSKIKEAMDAKPAIEAWFKKNSVTETQIRKTYDSLPRGVKRKVRLEELLYGTMEG